MTPAGIPWFSENSPSCYHDTGKDQDGKTGKNDRKALRGRREQECDNTGEKGKEPRGDNRSPPEIAVLVHAPTVPLRDI